MLMQVGKHVVEAPLQKGEPKVNTLPQGRANTARCIHEMLPLGELEVPTMTSVQ